MANVLFNDYDFDLDEAIKEYREDYEDSEITDEQIIDIINDIQNDDFENVRNELDNAFGYDTVLFMGTVGTWTGQYAAGRVGEFLPLFNDLLEDCELVKIVDEDGELKITCSHHDGTHYMTVRKLTDAGLEAWEMWQDEEGFDDLSERQMHELLFYGERYSVKANAYAEIYDS